MADELTPAQRSMRASIAAHSRWAREPDRKEAMRPALDGMLARFEKQVDPDGVLEPHIRAERAESAKKAYYKALQLKSSRARAANRGKQKAA
ncbi:hypothetical protein Drose_06575 [Dactylosporangium roseum]|uniref:Uncharacterized protein n=1 Tax=Dactylosporangium roseum TaxID=47989 RepID=A0ABY5Z7W0_9ACTN|nr:hypothetical protein [Dactylosporangium roseum]UWZ37937.1 hypothetical protein Drose_06575 [Dactylosporangium roseum]